MARLLLVAKKKIVAKLVQWMEMLNEIVFFVSFPNVYLLVCKYRYRSSSIGCKEKDSGQIGSINENVKWDDIFVIFPNVYHH